jgi:hypothetical protein
VGLGWDRSKRRDKMRKLGPRIHVKNDSESSIGRGCILHGAHFRPEIAKIVWSASRAAPPRTETLVLSEGYRDIRHTRDMHEELRALDITFRLGADMLPTLDEYAAVVARMKALLGPDYDVLVHGENSNRHIHCELDPK